MESDEPRIPWSHLSLLVSGRLSRKRVELQERKGGRGENKIQADSQFFFDEAVLDLYSEDPDAKFRILANGFDFSDLRGKNCWSPKTFLSCSIRFAGWRPGLNTMMPTTLPGKRWTSFGRVDNKQNRVAGIVTDPGRSPSAPSRRVTTRISSPVIPAFVIS